MTTWALRFALEWLVILAALSIAAQSSNPLVWWAAALVIGTRQHALSVLGHWAAHGLIPRWLAPACFAPMGVSTEAFRWSHWAHHRHMGHRGDPELGVVRRFAARWSSARMRDSLIDALGLHADEALVVLRMHATRASLMGLAIFTAAGCVALGPVALLWPAASATGFVFAHRLRARTEHDHINAPGATFCMPKPSLIARLIYLPHHTWRHDEHHAKPGLRVWEY